MVNERGKLCAEIDLKSLVLGILLVLCIVLLTGADNSKPRYLCCAAGGDELSVFVTDTETGQTWRLSRTNTYDYGTPLRRESKRTSVTPKS